MTVFGVNTTKMQSVGADMTAIWRAIRKCACEVGTVERALEDQPQLDEVRVKLGRLMDDLGDYAYTQQRMIRSLEDITDLYIGCERDISRLKYK